ncbi:putative Xaa-His dipeptidase [Monocercomonoides exilis]|uniref:putative Xaa-His dipeptidase n=1 Tax=Monocercomonoides exilis TaxID=2049356 RepID=UPI00355A3F81|nr:putative Xaa-His dipeptidase [Monocercomonoides exilis]|eukprot:MONOS_7306.1-p1 / transcript=MONOS_7306.1 / gene=MONOS_7306 / organism=Monocercomonoides_exilis_PA203 / gene_product=Xaa-His dipeptidase / transcript_product=Xaa-His dipeptidase / location=Mono_scaffold00247:32270-34472(-) / protein_length=512 / sequence_SO=supercontig / SO=protein_coding / is_pseudo=false
MTTIHPLFPPQLWKHFEMLLKTPRGSGNTKEIAEKVFQFGNSLKYETIRDEVGNVLIRKPASAGKEDSPYVCLQCHLDMVCEKSPKVDLDMTKCEITPVVVEDGEFGPKLMAKDTTLGADDGIGVATVLAILEDKDLIHGPLECLFTIDEEVGMVGARGIKPGFLKSNLLVNLDSEEDWRITVGCAGGFNVDHTLPIEVEKDVNSLEGCEAIHVSISDCMSGHSGCEIHLGRLNPIIALGRLLRRVEKNGVELRLAMIAGGTKRNVIPADSKAIIIVKKEENEKVLDIMEVEWNAIREECEAIEPNVKMEAIVVSMPSDPSAVLTKESSHKLLSAVITSPHGVLRMSPVVPGLVESSINFFSVRLNPESSTAASSEASSSSAASSSIVLSFFARSSSDSQLDLIWEQLLARCELLGMTSGPQQNFYHGWQPDTSTSLFKATDKAFREAHGKEPEIYAVHAGLECGILSGALEGLKCISLGPYVTSPHTTQESLHLKSIKPFYDTVKNLLKEL